MTIAASGPCLNTCRVRALHLRTGNLSMADRGSVVDGVCSAGLTMLRLVLVIEKAMALAGPKDSYEKNGEKYGDTMYELLMD